MRWILDLVLIPLVIAAIGGAIAGPWGVVLGAALGLYAGASFGTAMMDDQDVSGGQRVEELEREVAEKDRRIDELEARVEELEDG